MSTFARNHVLVLVVDDQVDRKSKYIDCLQKVNDVLKGKWILDLHFCHDLGTATALSREPGQAGLAIVDMVLDSSDWTTRSVNLLDRKLAGERWPLLLVSARFDEPGAFDRANHLLAEADERSFASQFLLWSTIEQAGGSPVVAHQLAFIVSTLLSRDMHQDQMFSKEPNQSVDLFHITDAHFGKATWDAGALMMLRAKLDELSLDGADFLILSGDIADHGTPSQYKAAATYLNAIAHNGLLNTEDSKHVPKSRVIMCPGNHDFSRPIALASNINSGKNFSLGRKGNPAQSWMRNLAWNPYYDFETEIGGHTDHWIENPGFRLNSKFKTAGLLFLELNVEKYDIEGYQPGFTDIEIKSRFNAALAEVANVRRRGDCVIVVAHRHQLDGWSALGQMLDSLLGGLGTLGPVLLFCGHEHTARVGPECGERALVVRGIPPMAGPSLPTMVLPVVHYLCLERAEGQVRGVSIHAFHQERTSWLAKGNSTRFLWDEKNGWCKAMTSA
jgi:predicted MPP superfamily phosphohydrolase